MQVEVNNKNGRSIRTERTHTIMAGVAMIACFIFGVAFVFDAVAYHYLDLFHLSNLLYYVRAVITVLGLVGLLIIALGSNMIRSNSIFISLSIIGLTLFGAIVGLLLNGANSAFFSHFQYYSSFLIVVALCMSLNRINVNMLKGLMILLAHTSLVIAAIFIGAVYTIIPKGMEISLNVTLLIMPIAFYLSNAGRTNFFWLTILTVLVFLSMKRSLWIAAFLGLLFLRKTTIISRQRLSYLWIYAVVLAASSVLLITISTDLRMADTIFDRLIARFANRDSVDIDSISSGRLGNFWAITTQLTGGWSVLTGLGFGAMIDLNKGTSLDEWITSGADVLPMHLWMLHGLIVGTLVLVVIVFFLIRVSRYSRFHSDPWFNIWLIMFALNFINSWFTFVPWDPIWPVSAGLLLARMRQLNERTR